MIKLISAFGKYCSADNTDSNKRTPSPLPSVGRDHRGQRDEISPTPKIPASMDGNRNNDDIHNDDVVEDDSDDNDGGNDDDDDDYDNNKNNDTVMTTTILVAIMLIMMI